MAKKVETKKPGYRTTEFWLTLGLISLAWLTELLKGGFLGPELTITLTGVLGGLYTTLRTLAKVRGVA